MMRHVVNNDYHIADYIQKKKKTRKFTFTKVVTTFLNRQFYNNCEIFQWFSLAQLCGQITYKLQCYLNINK